MLLLQQAEAAGVRLWLKDGALHYDAPDTDEAGAVLKELAAHKASVIAALQRRERRRFDQSAGPRWTEAWGRFMGMPHRELEQAIDAADPAAFDRELAKYQERGERDAHRPE
jgi:hypothetical protein